jgi:NADP-dependent aldehyde dehydrogenase
MITDSMLSASGQQCTCPGLIILDDSIASDALIVCVQDRLTNAQPQVMLSHAGVEHLHDSVSKIVHLGARVLIGAEPIHGSPARYAHTLLQIDANAFLDRPDAFQSEMFGVAALIVRCANPDQFTQIARVLEGNLTGTIHAEPQDEPIREPLARVLRTRVGRLIHNGVPTGVHVNPATVHGGPFPSTGHPGFTAVGLPTSIHRFAALRCYDRVEQAHLPAELRDENPTGTMMRSIDSDRSCKNIVPL